jgi:ABC-type branched-subunit amino acid transport system ATPase component
VFGTLGQNVGVTLLFGGVGLILVLRAYPRGIVGALQGWWQSRLDRMAAKPRPLLDHAPTGALRVTDVSVTFGGISALDGVAIEVRPGEIVGLIGPNGAGKTTLMNVIAGTLTPDHGRIELSGADVSGLAPELRSLFGLARSFQDASLFPGLTVTELLQVAASGRNRIGFVSAAVTTPCVRNAQGGSRAEAAEVEARFGLEAWADTLTSDLSTGTRRICDLAAQVIARPKLLLLDEPTGGVAQREAEAFGPLLRRIRSELDCSILIIEHDMPLLMGLCDRVYAMDLGQVIAEGSPEEIRNTPAVIASYLGTDETAIGRSGTATRSGSV